MTKWYLLLGAILSEVAGSLGLQAALDHAILYVPVVFGFTASFLLLTAVLRRGMPVGVAYGVWAALGVVLTSILSALLYGEPLTPLMAAGIALIMAGVLLVEMGSRPTHARTGAA